jgi:F-type H+-transporting ATPase subunit alpha
LELAQFEEVARFARFGTDLDEATQHQIERGSRLQKVLTQPVHQPLSQALQVLILFAITEGYMDEIGLESIAAFEDNLISHFKTNHPNLVHEIKRHGELTEEVRQAFTDSLEDVRNAWFERTDRA